MSPLLAAALAVAPVRAAENGSFRALFQTLVETDTTPASGSCTAAAGKMADAMKAVGFPATGLHPYATADHPQEGGLVAILPGSDRSAKALLLVAHIDVVPADARQWTHDPFKLTEADGYFHGRGVADNKAMAAILIDTLIRLHKEGFRPRRAIKVALTCGEETPTAFNGAEYLANQRRGLIDAGLAFVPSGGAMLDAQGRRVSLSIQAGEKTQQNFRLEATGTASHASRPTPDNAIYTLAEGLTRLAAYRFPVRLNDATRLYFARIAATAAPDKAAAIRALLANPADRMAQEAVTADPAWNGMLRTTCVATVIDTGRQANTVEARAAANVNCRLLPDEKIADVEAALTGLVDGRPISVKPVAPMARAAPAPPVTPRVIAPIEAVVKQMWPGVMIIPTMLTGATDSRHFNAVGIPTYGLSALFYDPDGNGVHAANERLGVRSADDGRAFVYRLVKAFAARAE